MGSSPKRNGVPRSGRRRSGEPDKGYSWVVCLACCYCAGILYGLLKCSGVLYLETEDFYAVSKEEASWPYSIMNALVNVVAPATGILGFRFGMRKVLLSGAGLATIGVLLCFFATSVMWITICYGVAFGFGFGIVYCLLPVIVSQYFVKYKSTAMGIMFAGDSIVTLVLPIFMGFMLDVYGFRGSFLIIGGLVMNILVMGSLLRTPPWIKYAEDDKQVSASRRNTRSSLHKAQGPCSRRSTQGSIHKAYEGKGYVTGSSRRNTRTSLGKIHEENIYENGVFNPSFVSCHEDVEVEARWKKRGEDKDDSDASSSRAGVGDRVKAKLEEILSRGDVESQAQWEEKKADGGKIGSSSRDSVDGDQEVKTKDEDPSQKDAESKGHREEEEKTESCTSHTGVDEFQVVKNCEEGHSQKDSESQIRWKKKNVAEETRNELPSHFGVDDNAITEDAEDTHSLKDIIIYPRLSHRGSGTISLEMTTRSRASIPNHLHNPAGGIKKEEDSLLDSFKIAGNILITPIFLVLALSNATFYFSLITYCTLIVDYGMEKGVPETMANTLIISESCGSLFGKLCLGWVTDRRFVSRKNFLMFTMTSVAIALGCQPFLHSFIALTIMAVFFGIVEGATVATIPLLLAEYMGQRTHAVSFGLLRFFLSILPFIRPSLIGYFKDGLGSYDGIFYVMGGINLLAAILWLFEPCITKTKR